MRLTRNAGWLLFGVILAVPLRSQNVSTVAGNTTWNLTITVRLDAAGNMYVPDYFNDVVYKVDSSGNPVIVAGTYQQGGFAGDGGLATNAKLTNPGGAVPAADGTLYITEYGGNRIRKVAPNGIITTFAGNGNPGFSGDGGPAGSAVLRNPWDILIDAAGNILFIDYNNARVRKITPAGTISTVAGFGTRAYSGDGSSALQAGMDPTALGLGTNGSYYIVDNGSSYNSNGRVRMVSASGTITTVAGNGSLTYSGDGGQATAAGLAGASGVALDAGGNLYISEYSGQRIRKVSPGGIITTYAGTGAYGSSGDNGPALKATFGNPRGLTIDSGNNLYVADGNNHRIRKISAAPSIETNGLVNGASFISGGIVPGEIATLFGTNLTFATGINLAGSLPLATQLLNVQVLVNGIPAPIFAVDNVNGLQQINFQVPYGVAAQGSTATVQVMDNGSAGNTITVPVIAAQPGMFTYSVGPTTFGAILHADFSLANTNHPAAAGETVQIFCTGLGAVSPTPTDGVAAAGADETVATATVTIGGAAATVGYAGLAPGFVGLYQVNALVPAGLATGNQPVIITISGAQSAIALLPVQ